MRHGPAWASTRRTPTLCHAQCCNHQLTESQPGRHWSIRATKARMASRRRIPRSWRHESRLERATARAAGSPVGMWCWCCEGWRESAPPSAPPPPPPAVPPPLSMLTSSSKAGSGQSPAVACTHKGRGDRGRYTGQSMWRRSAPSPARLLKIGVEQSSPPPPLPIIPLLYVPA